ncbi:MAG: 3-hydroxyacyl-ACP dehydratase [Saprospiraceae bacterium]|nr:3-hydroxyacyl-ACP dehydratase [Saprospiraceae bacterium]
MQDGEIFQFIPQAPPVVLVDRIITADEARTICAFQVKPEGVFVSDGVLSESGLTENMAQTAAAGVGYACHQRNEEVPVGYIASIRNLIIHELPPTGSELYTEIMVTDSVMDVSFVRGTIHVDSRLIAECEMRIFLQQQTTDLS